MVQNELNKGEDMLGLCLMILPRCHDNIKLCYDTSKLYRCIIAAKSRFGKMIPSH